MLAEIVMFVAHCIFQLEPDETLATTIVFEPKDEAQSPIAYRLGCGYPIGPRASVARVSLPPSLSEPHEAVYEAAHRPSHCSFDVANIAETNAAVTSVDDTLRLALSVQPNETLSIAPLNCWIVDAKSGQRERLTDELGCAIDDEPSSRRRIAILGGWRRRSPSRVELDVRLLSAAAASSIRFQCDCSPCSGKCKRVDCNEQHYKRRRRRRQQLQQDERLVVRRVAISPAIVVSPPSSLRRPFVRVAATAWFGEGERAEAVDARSRPSVALQNWA